MKVLNRIVPAAALLVSLVSCGGEKPAQTTAAPVAAAPATASTAPAAPPAAQPAPADAEKLVAELYKSHGADQSPFFQATNRELVDRYFEKELADLIWNDAVRSQGEVGALEFDPLYSSQDTQITNLAVQPAQVEGANARVVVSFENYGTKEQIAYSLTPASGSWKIADVHYSDNSTLRGVFRAYAALPESTTSS